MELVLGVWRALLIEGVLKVAAGNAAFMEHNKHTHKKYLLLGP